MKFKVGDKVIPKVFSFENDGIFFNSDMNKYIGKEQVITGARTLGIRNINLYQIDNDFEWVESALELVEPQEYFYVGQTVYSPFFKNKERKGVVVKVNNSDVYSVVCESEGIYKSFTLGGKRDKSEDFISLFQEPIQFPVNKPIERFEEGEIVEVSSNDEYWRLARFVSYNDHDVLRYKVTITTGIDREVKETFNYAKIRKIK